MQSPYTPLRSMTPLTLDFLVHNVLGLGILLEQIKTLYHMLQVKSLNYFLKILFRDITQHTLCKCESCYLSETSSSDFSMYSSLT